MRRLREGRGGPGGKGTEGALDEHDGADRRATCVSGGLGRRGAPALRRARRGIGVARPRARGRGDLAAHLPGCERCARTVYDTTEVMATMAADLPRAEPSDQHCASGCTPRSRRRSRSLRPRTTSPPAKARADRHRLPRVPAARAGDRAGAPSPIRRRLPSMALVAAAVAGDPRTRRVERLPRRLPRDLAGDRGAAGPIVEPAADPGNVTVVGRLRPPGTATPWRRWWPGRTGSTSSRTA